MTNCMSCALSSPCTSSGCSPDWSINPWEKRGTPGQSRTDSANKSANSLEYDQLRSPWYNTNGTIEFIPFSFWYDAPLTSRDSDRRHDSWLVYDSPICSLAPQSSWISPV